MRWLFGAAAALFVQTAPAQVTAETAPDALVRSVTQDVIGVVKQDSAIQGGHRERAIALVEEKVSPHFDFTRMTALAMGANWRKASPEQQKAVVEQFRSLLIRTYSSALSAYRDQAIEVKPPRSLPNDAEVLVRSEVKQPGAETMTIDYSMAKSPAGWKVYDVTVGGASLVLAYRDTCATEVRNGGIDGLIKSLSAKNQQRGSKST